MTLDGLTSDAAHRRKFAIQFKKIMKHEKDWRDSKKILTFLRKLGQPTSIRGIKLGVRGFSGERIKRLLIFLMLRHEVGKFRYGARIRYGALGCVG